MAHVIDGYVVIFLRSSPGVVVGALGVLGPGADRRAQHGWRSPS